MINVKLFIVCFFVYLFVPKSFGQGDRFYTCLQNLSVIDKSLEEHQLVIKNMLTSNVGDNFIFRYLQTCKEDSPEYGFQLFLDESNNYHVKSFHFSANVWYSAIRGNKYNGDLKLITGSKKISQNLALNLLQILEILFYEQDTISNGAVLFGGPCYNFYIQQGSELSCGRVTLPGIKTSELINIMDILSDLPCSFKEQVIENRLKILLFELKKD